MAVDSLNLTVEEGELISLLGVNGAGQCAFADGDLPGMRQKLCGRWYHHYQDTV